MTVAARDEAFYDAAMTDPDGPAMQPLETSPWLPVYEETLRWVSRWHPVEDLGCGTGRLLQLLMRSGHRGHLAGVDFSAAALAVAEETLRSEEGADRPSWAVRCEDLRCWQPDPERAGSTTYVCLEVLEHLEDDWDLVRRVPPGHQFVMSVPNYESSAHLRWFRGPGSVWRRYQPLLAIRRWTLVDLGAGKAIHLLDTTRRIDAW